ncbi:MAG: inorganic pyrophosphatase [Legionellales bacterium RIFCSPHIGHO2_12_FULL_35_11]|nr:MAG: inorganic pyrophosphatase [Legionellales bacterium RIFCSPHIGHO2_12_FULL_35_11]
MSLLNVETGDKTPQEVNIIIEIPKSSHPVKYEVDKKSGALFVDRFLSTSMLYPANYGYIPNTLSEDGDPVDALVFTPHPVTYGAVITCRVLGMLKMTDESGVDAKLVAVPIPKLCGMYNNIQTYKDLPDSVLKSIEHFFNHYKDLEEGKWVKVDGWEGVGSAHQEIIDSIARYQE